ncbi:hypothetical protein XELAEV_18012280mg [Xenopus laevis]|uniref:Uncharacterized protein n=1 Tax=Xenopus laevis TaxID=8355 RepID=A0A974DMB2_XENLA|nr:hypothetical protein XELAEV_18012280mg [Xenopus laevis]
MAGNGEPFSQLSKTSFLSVLQEICFALAHIYCCVNVFHHLYILYVYNTTQGHTFVANHLEISVLIIAPDSVDHSSHKYTNKCHQHTCFVVCFLILTRFIREDYPTCLLMVIVQI